MRLWILAALGGFALTHTALAAPPIDCMNPIAAAQKAIDKITGDLQGMDKMMKKSELGQIHRLVGEAKRLKKEAQLDCKPGKSPYTRAEAIARATAANGYATAADVLHFHDMEAMSSSGTGSANKGGMSGMKGMGNMQGAGNMPGMGNMSGGTPGTGGAPSK